MDSTPRERASLSDLSRRRAAVRDLLPGLVILLITEGSLVVVDPDASTGGWATVWLLSPLVAIALLAWGQGQILRRSDELERLQQLAAMSVGFGVFAVLLATVGVLQGAQIGDAVQQTQITFIAGIVAWIATLAVTMRKERS